MQNTRTNKVLQGLAVFFVFTVLLGKNPFAYLRPEFWAEDGLVFFKDAFELGTRSLFMPLGGYQNFIPRLLALFATILPTQSVPHFFAFTAVILSTLMLSFITSEGFSWFIPNAPLRFGLAVLFAFCPGSWEITSCLCNLHTVFAVFSLLLLLHRPFEFSFFKSLLWILVLLSTPEMPILIPVLLFLGYYERSIRYPILIASILLMLFWNGYSSHKYATSDYGLYLNQVFRILSISAERLAIYLFQVPVLGPKVLQNLLKINSTVYLLLCLVCLFVGIRFIFKRAGTSREKALLLTLLATIFIYFALVVATRPYLWQMFASKSHELFWKSRYAFVAVVASLLFWSHFYFSAKISKNGHRFFKLAFFLFGFFIIRDTWYLPERPVIDNQRQTLIELNRNKRLAQYRSPKIYVQPGKYQSFEIEIH